MLVLRHLSWPAWGITKGSLGWLRRSRDFPRPPPARTAAPGTVQAPFYPPHRLSTVVGADQILVLKDGRIAERGR